jgi:hypothetical protein
MVLTVTDCEQCQRREAAAKDLQEQNNELAQDRALADREIRRLRREAQALRRELSNAREQDPSARLVGELLEEWKHQTGHQRAKTPLDGPRADRVRRALGWGFSPQTIRKAFVGAGRFPYVVDFERSASNPDGSPRRDEIETVLRDERQIEKLAALADAEAKSEPRSVGSSAPDAKSSTGALEPVAGALQAHGFRLKAVDDGVLSQCPGCGDELFVRLLARDGAEMAWPDCYGVPACSTEAVLGLLGLAGGDLVASVPRVRTGPLPEHLQQSLRWLLGSSEEASRVA